MAISDEGETIQTIFTADLIIAGHQSACIEPIAPIHDNTQSRLMQKSAMAQTHPSFPVHAPLKLTEINR
jgi:hypothetical protein